MATLWKLKYETIPGDGEHEIKYHSFNTAKQEIRKIISRIDISKCTSAIRTEKNHSAYRTAIADFLDNYFVSVAFFDAPHSLPSSDVNDYPFDKSDTDDEAFDDYEKEDPDFDICIEQYFNNVYDLRFDSYFDGQTHLETNMLIMRDKEEEYNFIYYNESASDDEIQEISIALTPQYGSSAYPFLILEELERASEALSQEKIIKRIEYNHGITIERKAIGRNITLLKGFGYNICHNRDGYYIPKKAPPFNKEDIEIIIESIMANEAIDDKRKRELADKLFALK